MESFFVQKIVQGKITIPQAIREFLELKDGDFVNVSVIKAVRSGEGHEETEEGKKN